jgi:hypothetical protein
MITMPAAAEVGDLIQRVEELKKKLISAPSTTQVPIVSSVPASSIAESAAARVLVPAQRAGIPRPSFVRSTPVQPSTAPPTSALRSTLTQGEVTSRWQEFIHEVRAQKIALGSVMDSATPLGVNDGVIRLGCANEFQASSIKRNRDLLGEIALKVFNVPARIAPEVVPLTQKSQVTETEAPVTAIQDTEHPVIRAIIRELGAEPLE